MKKTITTVLLLFSLFVNAQQTLIKVNGWNAYVHVPSEYATTTRTFPTIIFFPGIGEVGSNASLVISNGPGAYITQGWNGNSDTTHFIVISLQPPQQYPVESWMNQTIQLLYGLYRIDRNRVALTGLSMGGWCASTFVTGDPLNGPYVYCNQIASVVTVEGMKPDDNSPYPTLFDNFAKTGGKYLGFEQSQDGRDTKTVTDEMNKTVSGSGFYVQTSFGGGAHCCWEQFYGGSAVQPNPFPIGGVSQTLYQWIAKQSLGAIVVPPVTPPPAQPKIIRKTYFYDNGKYIDSL